MALGQEDLGKRISEARNDVGLTQPELAEKIGLKHPQTVSRYERGLHDVPAYRLRRIAEATGKPLSFFLGEEAVTPAADPRTADVLQRLEAAATAMTSAAAQIVAIAERLEAARATRPADEQTQ